MSWIPDPPQFPPYATFGPPPKPPRSDAKTTAIVIGSVVGGLLLLGVLASAGGSPVVEENKPYSDGYAMGKETEKVNGGPETRGNFSYLSINNVCEGMAKRRGFRSEGEELSFKWGCMDFLQGYDPNPR